MTIKDIVYGINALRVTYLQVRMVPGLENGNIGFQINFDQNTQARVELVGILKQAFIFESNKTVSQIKFLLKGKLNEEQIENMIQHEIDMWLRNSFLILPPAFKVYGPKRGYFRADLI